MIYGPTALYSVGQGAIVPLLPVVAAQFGAHLAAAALVPAALVVGQLLGNIPAGWLVARAGERRAMTIAAIGSLLGAIIMLFAQNVPLLALASLTVGFFAASFAVARHTFMTTRVPLTYRARALSLLGGSFRLGAFTGPFLAAAMLAVFGTERASIWFFAAMMIGVGLLVTFGPDPETRISGAPAPRRDEAIAEDTGEPVTGSIPAVERVGVFRTMWRNRRVLSRLGVAAASLAAVRGARQTVLPLWGVSIGLDASTIALVVGVAGALDFALFYVSGQVMDRFGRIWAAVPSAVLMGGALVALAFTHDVPQAVLWFGVFAIVIGVGNGLSSGILLTVGADVAPQDEPATFLGAWRTITDAGGATTPLIFSGLTALFSLSVATGAIGAIGLLGALAFLRWLPRYAPER
ncbi:MFS transporter [Microbacterium sediminis]|uniref:MFS transporter n=2 Tax=Microbacterium sediminis TaxID=904291 RepID=A0A1B9NFP4_9MICO|nr:MFS transporter [Microbacterium sediminis]OCG75418.1 MFS transporter [Microbacterium sediminis]QBR75458.1 MFS transporter [Microbacterium sediminis]